MCATAVSGVKQTRRRASTMWCAGVLDVKQAAHLDRQPDALPQCYC